MQENFEAVFPQPVNREPQQSHILKRPAAEANAIDSDSIANRIHDRSDHMRDSAMKAKCNVLLFTTGGDAGCDVADHWACVDGPGRTGSINLEFVNAIGTAFGGRLFEQHGCFAFVSALESNAADRGDCIE